MVRIPQSRIQTQQGGNVNATAKKTSNGLAQVLTNLGSKGVELANQLEKKRSDAELIDFKGGFNREMTQRSVDIKNKTLNMDQNGDLLDLQGAKTGRNIQDDLDELEDSRTEYLTKAEGLTNRNRAVDYLSNVRSQDGMRLQLGIEKKKDKLRRSTTISTVRDFSELFANDITNGKVDAQSMEDINGVMADARAVVGDEEFVKMQEQLSAKSYNAYISSVQKTGRNANAERALASLEGTPEWRRERINKSIEKADEAYKFQAATEVSNMPSKLQAATTDIKAYQKSRAMIASSLQKPLSSRGKSIPGIVDADIVASSQRAIGSAANMETSVLGLSPFEQLRNTDGSLTEAGSAAEAYIDEVATDLVKSGSLNKAEKESFIAGALESAASQKQATLESVAPQAKANLIARTNAEVLSAAQTGNHKTMVDISESLYIKNGISDDERSYVNLPFAKAEKKEFAAMSQIDRDGALVANALLQRAITMGDKFDGIADTLIKNKTYPAYAAFAGKLKGNSGFLGQIAASEKVREQALKNLKYTEESFKTSAFNAQIGAAVNELDFPSIQGNMYGTAARSTIESLALAYTQGGVYKTSEEAVAKAKLDFEENFVPVKSGSAGGMIYSRQQLEAINLEPEVLKDFAKDGDSAVEFLATKGQRVDIKSVLSMVKNDPSLAEFATRLETIPGFNRQAVMDVISDRLVVTSKPNDSTQIRVMFQTNKGLVPVPFTNKKGDRFKGDMMINEINEAAGKYNQTTNEERAEQLETTRYKMRVSQMINTAKSMGNTDLAAALKESIS